jgi:hypothetical protein
VESDSRSNKTGARCGSPVTLVISVFSPPPSPPERASTAAGVATRRRSGAVARLLADGRCSPEGERAVVEQSRCDALIRELEPVNPRVDAGEPRVSFPDSDEVRSGDGLAQVSPKPLILMLGFLKIWGFFVPFSIRFLFNLIHAVGTLDLNKSSQLRGPDSKTILDPKILTLALDANDRQAEVLVLSDRLGRHLVDLKIRRGTSLRVLGLACLTRGLVR